MIALGPFEKVHRGDVKIEKLKLCRYREIDFVFPLILICILFENC